MSKASLALFLFMGSSAFAATKGYDLKMDLSMNGKKVSSPRMIVQEGVAGTIEQETSTEKTFIEVVATEGTVKNNKGILMKFTVGYIEKDGTRTIVSKPQILAKENETAQITVGDNKGKDLSLSVIAQRTTF